MSSHWPDVRNVGKNGGTHAVMKGSEMGFLDKFKAKATKAVDQHGDKIKDGLDKVGDAVDKKTGGKHTDKIDSAKDKATDALDNLDGKDDNDIR